MGKGSYFHTSHCRCFSMGGGEKKDLGKPEKNFKLDKKGQLRFGAAFWKETISNAGYRLQWALIGERL